MKETLQHRVTTGLQAAVQASAEVHQVQVLQQDQQAEEAAVSAEAAAAVAAE